MRSLVIFLLIACIAVLFLPVQAATEPVSHIDVTIPNTTLSSANTFEVKVGPEELLEYTKLKPVSLTGKQFSVIEEDEIVPYPANWNEIPLTQQNYTFKINGESVEAESIYFQIQNTQTDTVYSTKNVKLTGRTHFKKYAQKINEFLASTKTHSTQQETPNTYEHSQPPTNLQNEKILIPSTFSVGIILGAIHSAYSHRMVQYNACMSLKKQKSGFRRLW